tara:strand:- start:1218 stop:1475 length:258 start_codon:yes stop_codon:yes gene_type:complete
MHNKFIAININNEKINIQQNEFWYFKNMLNEISNYYDLNENRTNSILLKIPGTGKFKKINHEIFCNLNMQINSIIKKFKNELDFI